MSQPIFASETVAISQCKYGPMMYLRHDLYIGRSLEIYGEWYDLEIELLKQFIALGDVVLDVGANIGTHTIAFAKMVGPTGQVVAFEPQRLIHNILNTNIMINDLKNVQALHCAAGHEHGTVKIPFLDASAPNNFGGLNMHQFDSGEDVQVIKIDDLNLGACKLIKIDVEGAEANVLRGAAATIQKYRPFLFVENNGEATAGEINATLLSLGYECWWFLAPNFRTDNFRGVQENHENPYLEGNLLCIPREMSANMEHLEPLLAPDDTHRRAMERMLKKVA